MQLLAAAAPALMGIFHRGNVILKLIYAFTLLQGSAQSTPYLGKCGT